MGMFHLRLYRGNALSARDGHLLRCRLRTHPAAPTVITDPIATVVSHVIVVNILHARAIDIGYRAVVIQVAAIPISAIISAAGVSITVIDVTVVADVRRPVARMPEIVAVVIAPPWRSPKRTDVRR
jgi:hypothetical protein